MMAGPSPPPFIHLVHDFAQAARLQGPLEESQLGALQIPGHAQNGHGGGVGLAQILEGSDRGGRQSMGLQLFCRRLSGGHGRGDGVEQGAAGAAGLQNDIGKLVHAAWRLPNLGVTSAMPLAIWLSARAAGRERTGSPFNARWGCP